MNLHLGHYFLFAGLLSTVWAQQVQEVNDCGDLVKTTPLDGHSGMLGKWFTIAGYTNSSLFNGILNITDSSWMNIVRSQGDRLVMLEANKFNGTCVRTNVSMTVEGDRGTAIMGNLTSVFNLLPSCDGCLVIRGTTIMRDAKTLLKAFKLQVSIPEEDIEEHVASAIYLMAKNHSVKPEDREKFKQQASCLGFTGEPNYDYDANKAFCGDNEGFFMQTAGEVADI